MAKITKTTAAKPAAKKPAAKPAVKKEKNPDAFLNKFGMPVIKLGLVGALTAGVIGLTNELTKDSISDNWYEFALSSYMDMGESIEGWERHETEENFSIISEGTTGSVTEYMVYCETSVAEACGADSSDAKGVAFSTEANHGGYGNMVFQVAVSLADIVNPEIVAYNQLGFVTSFGGQSTRILEDLDAMVERGDVLDGGSYTSGASTTVTIGGIQSMLNDMRTTYDAVAVAPAVVLDTHLTSGRTYGNLDGAATAALITETTEINLGYTNNNAAMSAKFDDGSYFIMYNFGHDYVANARVMFHINADGTFTWDLRDSYFGSNDGYGSNIVQILLNNGTTTSIADMNETSVIAGGSDTTIGYQQMITDMKLIWADKGGFE